MFLGMAAKVRWRDYGCNSVHGLCLRAAQRADGAHTVYSAAVWDVTHIEMTGELGW